MDSEVLWYVLKTVGTRDELEVDDTWWRQLDWRRHLHEGHHASTDPLHDGQRENGWLSVVSLTLVLSLVFHFSEFPNTTVLSDFHTNKKHTNYNSSPSFPPRKRIPSKNSKTVLRTVFPMDPCIQSFWFPHLESISDSSLLIRTRLC